MMKCTWQKRFGRVGANFGISFFTPLIGINLSNSIFQTNDLFLVTILQAFLSALIYTGLSVSREVSDWSKK